MLKLRRAVLKLTLLGAGTEARGGRGGGKAGGGESGEGGVAGRAAPGRRRNVCCSGGGR
jgi:hypothetical protein